MKQKITKGNTLKNIIKESVKQTINELDWKTYANAAKKRLQQYRDDPTQKDKWDKYYDLSQAANEKFDDDYVGLMKYDTFGDKLRGKHSPQFAANINLSKSNRMPYGAINGYNKGGNKIFSTDKNTYHTSNGGITNPSRFFRDKEVADKFKRANDELWDYDNGNYEYASGEGWRLKESKRIRNIVKETLNRVLRESVEDWYAEEDYDGNTGQPGQVRSYDVGYVNAQNEEMAAQEQGYEDVADFLKEWFFEIQPDCPWTWQKLGNGYGYHGTTIFNENGVVCKEIYGQIMFDEYPPGDAEYEEDFQNRLNKGEYYTK